MASSYYIGSMRFDKCFKVYRPLIIKGSVFNCISDLLKLSGIDVYEDFCYFETDDRFYPLFYKQSKIEKPEWEIDETDILIDMCSVSDSEYPLVCDGVERNGVSYHIYAERVVRPSYAFKRIFLTEKNIGKLLEGNSWFNKNHNAVFITQVVECYEIVSAWIEDNSIIYCQKYY